MQLKNLLKLYKRFTMLVNRILLGIVIILIIGLVVVNKIVYKIVNNDKGRINRTFTKV